MGEIGIGLPNQALKSFVSTFQNTVNQTVPYEKQFTSAALVAATETDLVPLQAMPTNMKTFLTSLKVTVTVIDTIIKLYRSGVLIMSYEPGIINNTQEAFANFVGGREYDESETIRVTATSATGGGTATISLSGRSQLKHNEEFSQVIG